MFQKLWHNYKTNRRTPCLCYNLLSVEIVTSSSSKHLQKVFNSSPNWLSIRGNLRVLNRWTTLWKLSTSTQPLESSVGPERPQVAPPGRSELQPEAAENLAGVDGFWWRFGSNDVKNIEKLWENCLGSLVNVVFHIFEIKDKPKHEAQCCMVYQVVQDCSVQTSFPNLTIVVKWKGAVLALAGICFPLLQNPLWFQTENYQSSCTKLTTSPCLLQLLWSPLKTPTSASRPHSEALEALLGSMKGRCGRTSLGEWGGFSLYQHFFFSLLCSIFSLMAKFQVGGSLCSIWLPCQDSVGVAP